jgi:hypothetical protein
VKKQLTLASNEFERFRKATRRERFLAEMNTVVPWAELCALIEPHYPQAGSAGGQPAAGLGRMLRIHCLLLWFDRSDPAVEESLYESRAMRAVVDIELGREPVPDETTVMRFRHLLEHNGLGEKIFEEVGQVPILFVYMLVAGNRCLGSSGGGSRMRGLALLATRVGSRRSCEAYGELRRLSIRGVLLL